MNMEESLDVPLPHTDVNGHAAAQGERCIDEDDELIVNDLDSFWDDVNATLHISRTVNESVMKGAVSAVHQEAARQIASKDAEIELLNQKLQELRNSGFSSSEGRDRHYDELHSIRQQLDTISKSLLNSEWGLSVSQYNNFEGAEDVGKRRGKEQPSKDGLPKGNDSEESFFDSSCLKHMDRDGLIAHFNKTMNQMKRQHDSAVQEQTEEIFKLKRKFLQNEGPNSWHLRNNKEFELVRKKVCEAITKLDEFLMDNKRTIRARTDAFPGQQDKSKVVDSHSQQVQGAATNNGGEACTAPSQDSHFASIEADHADQIRRLESDIEDARTTAIIREEIEKIILAEFINEIRMGLHGYEMEFNMKQDICSIIETQAIAEAMPNIDSSLLKYNEEKVCSEAAASLQKQEIEKLKLVVDSFSAVMREKEEVVSQIGLETIKGHMDLLCQELGSLRDKVEKQDSYISEKSREFNVIVGRLEQALQHVHHNEITLSELNGRFGTLSDSLREVEKQNQVLHTIIEEKEKTFTSTSSKEKEFTECIQRVVESMVDFEKHVINQQTTIANKVQHNESRVCSIKEQCKHLVKESNLLRKKALRYKEISETRGSNLQKAELEVDLLGDEVEALVDLLSKIYVALDHYSPVLQHYTGVMEILNMIKKHISMAK